MVLICVALDRVNGVGCFVFGTGLMFNYIYKVKDADGNLIAGNMLADRQDVAINILKNKGYYLISVQQENKFSKFFSSNAGFGNRVSVKDLAVFTHQFATLLKAGMQLTMALKTLSKQTQNKYLTSLIKEVHSDIERSCSLSEAMEKHPKVFSKVYTAIIAAAEESGSLAETLAVMSEQLKAQADVRSRIRGAMVYPIFLLVASAAIVGVLSAFVIPKFTQLFINANQKLPLPTKILVGSTGFLKNFWPVLIVLIVAGVIFGIAALKNSRTKFYFDSIMLRLPVIGTLNKKLQLACFSRTLGSLLNGGVMIVTAINTTKNVTSNTAFAKEIGNIEEGILKGNPLAKMIKDQKYFSEIVTNMIAVGEDTGTLPEMLSEVAEMNDKESEAAINSLTSLLGPVMIVILGLVIGFVVLAILMPIFEASTMVG